jgi:hypothetical protein
MGTTIYRSAARTWRKTSDERNHVMMRQRILNTLLIATFGAMAATAAAQTAAPAQNATPPTTGTSGGMMAPSDSTMNTPMDTSVPKDMRGYKIARTACDKQPMDSREKCRTTLNTRYSAVAPKCQKLSGSALDDCLKGADTGQ